MGVSASLPGGKDLKHNVSIYVDKTYGSPSGEIDNESKAFDTIQGAVTALIADGGTEYNMYVSAGVYDELVDCSTVVSFTLHAHFASGATHQYTGADPGQLYFGNLSGNTFLNIYGYGVFDRLGTNPTDSEALGGSVRIFLNVYGFMSINSSQSHAVEPRSGGVVIGYGRDVSTITSSASLAVSLNAPCHLEALTARSTASSTLGSSNSIWTVKDCLIESTVSGAVRFNQFAGGFICDNVEFVGDLIETIFVFGILELRNGCIIRNLWDNAAGHGIRFNNDSNVYRYVSDGTTKIILANSGAISVLGTANVVNARIYGTDVYSNDVAASQPAISTMTPTGPINAGDSFTVTKTVSSDTINYVAVGGDGVPQVLAGLKAAWLARVGTGDDFDEWLQGNVANDYLLDITSGTDLVATSAAGAYVAMSSGIFTVSVVGAGAGFTEVQNQSALGFINQISGTSIVVDSNVI